MHVEVMVQRASGKLSSVDQTQISNFMDHN